MRKAMTSVAMFLLVVIIALPQTSCDLGGSSSTSCPSLSDNVTWTSYSQYKFASSGDDGTARGFVSNCGWHVYQGNDGGYSATLQVASPGEEVVLVWAWNNFYGYRLFKGWTGQTDKGIRLGDTMSAFQVAYPEFVLVAPGQLEYTNPNANLPIGVYDVRDAYFDQNGLLIELSVGAF